MSGSSLPTGGCQYRLLDKEFTCGCQWFRPKRRKNSGDDDDDDECRCGHDLCYHKFEPVHNRASVPARPLSVTTTLDDAAAANPAALSSTSGTTTEREPSTSCTPSTAMTTLKPSFPKLTEASPLLPLPPPLHPAPGPSSRQTNRHQKAPVQQRTLRALVPSSSSSSAAAASKGELRDLNTQLRTLIDAMNGLKNNQVSQHDRIETIEGLSAGFEDLYERIDLLDQGIDERHYSFETRLENKLDEKLDERLAPLENFMKSYSERKRKRKHARRDSEAVENSSSIRGDRKRRKRTESEPRSQSGQFGFTKTTTTSFTTTTSTSASFSTSSPVIHRADEVQTLKFQIEQLMNRVRDVEDSGAPSRMRPWEIEVVLIPPSTLLHGAWQDVGSSNSSTQHTGSSELAPTASALPRVSNPAPTGVMPRSFSQKSKTYRRLASRGFVRRLHITGPTAREFAIGVEGFFLHLLNWCASFALTTGTPSQQNAKSQYSGTDSQRTARGGGGGGGGGRQPTEQLWQPLRKIYRQTVLEYLPPTDLATPALWTVDYLKVNCMMHSSHRKVVYIMPTMDHASIKWEDVHQLERFVDYDPVTGQEKPVGDESVWNYDFRLDGRVAKERQSIVESFVSENLVSEELVKASFKGAPGIDAAGGQAATPPDTIPPPQRRTKARNKLSAASTPRTTEEGSKETPRSEERRTSASTSSSKHPPPSPPASAPLSTPPQPQPHSESRPQQQSADKSSPTSQSTNCPSEQHVCSSLSVPPAPPSFDEIVGHTAGWGLAGSKGGEQGEDEEWGEDVLALFEDVDEGVEGEEVAIVGGVVGGGKVLGEAQEEEGGGGEGEGEGEQGGGKGVEEDEDEEELLLPPLPPPQQVSGVQDSGDGGYVSD